MTDERPEKSGLRALRSTAISIWMRRRASNSAPARLGRFTWSTAPNSLKLSQRMRCPWQSELPVAMPEFLSHSEW